MRGVPAMKAWLPFVVVGITTGSLYALAGVGLVLTFKTSNIFNFAHGAQAALGAYLMFELRQRSDIPWPVAALVALLLAGVVAGLVLERVAVALAKVPIAARVGATVGLVVGIQAALWAIFGIEKLTMDYFLPTKLLHLPGVNVRIEQVIVTLLALAAAGGLYVFLARTRLGVAMMAVVDDPDLAGLKGTNPTSVRRWAWVIGSCLAAASGMLLAPTAGLDAGVLTLLVFYAFGAAAVGAFDSLPLTYLGGVGIGLGAALMTKVVTGHGVITALPSTLPFLVLFIALLVTPKARLVERGDPVVRRALPPLRLERRVQAILTALAVGVLVVIPHVAGTKVPLYTSALAFVILFASLSVLVRTSGQISLCHMTFAAIGAVTFARSMDHGVPWALAVLLAGLVATPAGALVAIPAIRLSGIYLAIATFGFALLVQNLVFPASWMFGNFSTILRAPRPRIGGLHTYTDTGYYYVALGVTAVCLALIVAVRRGRMGRLLQCLGDASVALDAHGTNTNITRLWVFCISAFLAGVGGAVLAPVTGTVSGSPFGFTISLTLVAVLFIAGRQPLLGAFLAAAIYQVGPGYIDNSTVREYLPVFFGAGALITAMAGGLPILNRLQASKRSRERLSRSPVRARMATAEAAR